MKFLRLFTVLSFTLIEFCECWLDLSWYNVKQKKSTHFQGYCPNLLRRREIRLKRFTVPTIKRSMTKVPDDFTKQQESESENRTSGNRAIFAFSDWSQFLPGNISTDDAAAAGVLGMMMRAIDAGKKSNQDSTLSVPEVELHAFSRPTRPRRSPVSVTCDPETRTRYLEMTPCL